MKHTGLNGEKFAEMLCFLRYLCAQLFEELRFLLLKPLIYFCPKKQRTLLGQLRKSGFVVIRGFYSPSEIAAINHEIDGTIRPLLTTAHPGLSVIPGSSRFRRPENKSLFFKSLSREIYWIAINAIYSGTLRTPGLMLSFTEKEARKEDVAQPDDEIQFFASHPHFDSYKHELKVVIALTNVDEYSGPTEIASASSHYHFTYWKEYFSSWLAHRGLLEDKTKTISEDFYLGLGTREKMLLSPGDVALFDSRTIHRATPLTKGKRDLLWYYF